ncbi:hypothetical protein TIFTF001_034584 [Ficus carica]|uniref:Uncharacterized protein n=1 Tax=Ficus carica TaxID=3494 RepID=A0AA88J5C1_FICCA|nr:hypothetical protein TIFTF001_034584 [Ficus carica]
MQPTDHISSPVERGRGQIGDLEDPALLVEKQIVRLEITVEDAMGVAVGDALAELVEKAPDQIGRQRPRIGAFAVEIDEFLEIGVEVLEDEVEDGLGGLGGVLAVVGVLDAEEADDVERLESIWRR